MATLCPICKTHILILGGQVAKDGYFCGKCWDKVASKKIYNMKNLTLNEIAAIINEIDNNPNISEDKLKVNLDEIKVVQKEYEEKSAKEIEKFKIAFSKFFQSKGIEENSTLQNISTQFLWHMIMLKKLRLNAKSIKLESTITPVHLLYGRDFIGEVFSDGKYEIGTSQQTVTGETTYLKEDTAIYREDKFNTYRFRTINTQTIGPKIIICPSCGHQTDRNNLIDGCDYCNSKFKIEDLGFRISEFSVERDYDTEANLISEGKKKIKGVSIFGGIFGAIFFVLYLIAMITGQIPFTFGELGKAILSAAFVWGVSSFFYNIFKKVFGFTSAFRKSSKQRAKKYLNEEKRRGKDQLDKIRKFDKLFSSEGFYSEIQNTICAIHYASKTEQISAFFEGDIKNQLKPILEKYNDVIDIFFNSLSISDFSVDDKYQKIQINMILDLLEEQNSKVTKKNEKLALTLIKDINCKTQAVCSPLFLRCDGCGASLDLMKGAKCHFCGNDRRLSKFGWAIKEYKTN